MTRTSQPPWLTALCVFAAVVGATVGITLVLAVLSIRAHGATTPERCAALRELAAAWQGIELTQDQKRTKAKLVAWYRANCGKVSA